MTAPRPLSSRGAVGLTHTLSDLTMPKLPLPDGQTALDRRGFLTTAGGAAISAVLLAACSSGDSAPTAPGGTTPAPGSPPPATIPAGVERVGSSYRIDLARVPALRETNGFLIIGTIPAAIVVNLGSNNFRAFTAVCTHDNCLVSSFGNNRITCNCHGSQFDTTGRVITGPATQPLRSFTVIFDAASQQLTVDT